MQNIIMFYSPPIFHLWIQRGGRIPPPLENYINIGFFFSYTGPDPMENHKATKPAFHDGPWERSGSVVECLTRDRRAAGSSLAGVTALCPWARTLILA